MTNLTDLTDSSLREIKAVLVGCGSMSNSWLNPAKNIPGLRIVGLVDLHRPAAVTRAQQHGLPESVVFDTLKDAIASTKPDVVFDVTIPAAHKSVTLEALAAGCHVLGEKPMAESLEDAQAMVAAAKASGKIYAVIQNRRYDPNIRTVRDVLANGSIGPVAEIHADFFLGPHFGGFRDVMQHPLLVDMAIHTFDQARYASGADPVAVYCHAFNPPHSWYKGEASAIAIFEMTNGIVYIYRGSWSAQGLPTSWNASWRFVCGNGSLTWDGEKNIQAQSAADPSVKHVGSYPEITIEHGTLEHQAHDGLIREFVDCVRTGGRPLTHCEDNIKSLAMVLAAVKSAASGQREKVVW